MKCEKFPNKDCNLLTCAAKRKCLWHEEKQSPRSAGVWVKASERLPKIMNKTAKSVHARALIKSYDGKTEWVKKVVVFYFPDKFKTIEFEDWDDWNEKDFPYTENDSNSGCVWLKAGWYSSIDCDNCEGYWSAPLNIIEWLDEAYASEREPAGEGYWQKRCEAAESILKSVQCGSIPLNSTTAAATPPNAEGAEKEAINKILSDHLRDMEIEAKRFGGL